MYFVWPGAARKRKDKFSPAKRASQLLSVTADTAYDIASRSSNNFFHFPSLSPQDADANFSWETMSQSVGLFNLELLISG